MEPSWNTPSVWVKPESLTKLKPINFFDSDISVELNKRLNEDDEFRKLVRKHTIDIYTEQIEKYDNLKSESKNMLKILMGE